ERLRFLETSFYEYRQTNQFADAVSAIPGIVHQEEEKMMIKKDPPLDQTGSKRQKEGGVQASASTPSEKATKGAGRSTTGTQSRQQSASQSAHAEEPVQTTCQMEETLLPVYETGADD
nr:hypothetical protein [Tanacetum cinerariifolium]